MLGQVYLSGTVCMLSCLKSPQGLQEPSVFFTICSGEAQLLLERRMTPYRSISLNSALAALSLAGSKRLYLAATGLPVVSIWCWTLWMTGGRSFAALKTDGNSLSSSAPKAQVPFALPTAGGVPTGGAEEMTAAVEESTAAEEESTAGEGEEESTAAEGESTAGEGEEESTPATEEEPTAGEEEEESTATAAGRMPHLLYGLLPAGASKEIAGKFLLCSRRWRTSTSKSNAARKLAPNMGNATSALRNFQGYQTPPAFNGL